MQFETTGDASHPYKIIFEGEEIDVIKAVFREEMFRQAQKGNASSISKYDITLADWDDTRTTLPTRIISPADLARKLEDFHDNANDAIVEIGLEYGTPPFLNDDIILRRSLGEQALELANIIRQEAATCNDLSKVDIEALDMDAEISSLLERSKPSDTDED